MKYDPIAISDVFFSIDPFHTGCKEEETCEEYDFFAQAVVERMVLLGASLEDSINAESSYWFSMKLEEDLLEKIVGEIETIHGG